MNDDGNVEIRLPEIESLILRLDDGTIAKEILHVWTQRVRTFLERRFDKNSRGGGDWRPLSPETIRRKMKKAKANQKRNRRKNRAADFSALDSSFGGVSILMDTGVLRAALNPQKENPGYVQRQMINGEEATVSLGFGGDAKHPESKSGITIVELARIHHFGTRRGIPARPIIVLPDDATWEDMRTRANRIIGKRTQ